MYYEIEKYDVVNMPKHYFSEFLSLKISVNVFLIPTSLFFLRQGRLLHILPGKPPKQETDLDGGNSNFKKKKQDDQKKNSQRLVTVD